MRPALPLVCVLVLFAGCGGSAPAAGPDTPPTERASGTTAAATDATATATTTRGDDDLHGRPAVEGGTLPFDPNVTFDRLEAMLAVDAEQPTVRVRDEAEFGDYTVRGYVFELFGVANGSQSTLAVSGSAGGPTSVAVGFSEASPAAVRGVLVHEMTHAVQVQRGIIPYGDVSTFDERQVRLAVIEGGAVYASTAFVERYDVDGRNWTAFFRGEYLDGPGGNRYAASTSYFGARYYAAVVDHPGEFESVAANPPRTTEGILHPHRNDTAPAPLAVDADRTGGWTATSADRYGELFTRVVLGSELPEGRAATAAAGWGNDSLVRFDRGDGRALAWVHRWDSAGDADEFVAAFGDYGDARSRDTDARFRVVRVNATTTAAFAGHPAFVANATVEGGDTVRLGVANGTAGRRGVPHANT